MGQPMYFSARGYRFANGASGAYSPMPSTEKPARTAAITKSPSWCEKLPPGLDPAQVPNEIIQQLLQQVQQAVPGIVTEQTRRQSPVLRIEARLQNGYWQDVTSEAS